MELLHSVVSSSILDGEGVQDSSIESLMLVYTYLDASKFLTNYRFPKLRVLHLLTCVELSPWDHLKLQATSLTQTAWPHPNCFRFSPRTRIFKTFHCLR